MGSYYRTGSNMVVNVDKRERIISVVAGSLLLCAIIKKKRGAGLLAAAGGYLLYKGISGHSPFNALRDRMHIPGGRNINVHLQLIVNSPRPGVYAFWRKLENMNLFMEHVENIRVLDEKRSLWQIRVPGGLGRLEWEAEIVREEENREVSWISLPGSDIDNAGKISFSDSPGNGTRIDVLISYRAPLGKAGEKVSRLFTPLFKYKIEEDIRNFKYYIENVRAMHP